ncbi:MAG TPA: hypothetical protein VJ942_15775 [Roseovarius sp.]|nr:hypothetical protein [Roseovarius sp.]
MSKYFTLTAAASLATALAFSPAPALAGDATMARSDGTQLKIKCRGSGCTVRGKNPGGKWGVVEKGPGGSKNFKKLKAKYEGMGFSD